MKLTLIFSLRKLFSFNKLLLDLVILTSRGVLVTGKNIIGHEHHRDSWVLKIKRIVVQLNWFISVHVIIIGLIMMVFG